MYDVFISYCSKNEKKADLIHTALKKQGYTCWYAPADLYGTEDFVRVIPPAIRDSKAFLLLLSPDSQDSKWVYRELRMADEENKPIFTLFLENFDLDETFRFLLQSNHHYMPTMTLDQQISHLLADLPKVLSEDHPTPSPTPAKKKRLPLILGAAVLVVIAIIAAFFLLRSPHQDGSYVIWNPAYSTALSRDTINTYYLAGETVIAQGTTLTSVSQKSVWELDFDGDTFTMTHNGESLGVQPGYNGIGLGGAYTADTWELVDAGDGYYYIRNTETGSFLEWYAAKSNWCTYAELSTENNDLFLLRLDPEK